MFKFENMKDYFPNNLKNLRVNNNLTQQGIADSLGISRSSYSSYETGVSEPSIEVLIKMSIFFNCTIDDLLKNKMDTSLIKMTKLSVDLDKFNYLKLKVNLLKARDYYNKKKNTILDEIDDKIAEIDVVLKFLDENIKGKISENLMPEINTLEELKNTNYINIPYYENRKLIKKYPISSDLISPNKKYCILKVNDDSMNNFFEYGELVLVEETNQVENDDIIIAVVNNKDSFKKIFLDDDNILLIPQSNNSIHKTTKHKICSINIFGKVIGKLTNFTDL